MSSTMGERLKISIFGESHGGAIGVVIDGFPAGEEIDFEALQRFLNRRAPGQLDFQTKRHESDIPEFLSGVLDGITTGAPICAIIKNENTHSKDYDMFRNIPRPSHADYPALLRYNGFNDIRGGGHFSGRLTAPLCIAGGLALQFLARHDITIGAHIASIGSAHDTQLDPVNVDATELHKLKEKSVPVLDDEAGHEMIETFKAARDAQDSVGGIIECAAVGYPAGIGSPIFGGLENRLATSIFGIPAVRGLEFGIGFESATMQGSTHNDTYTVVDGNIKTCTNNHGGIIGGISTGMPIILRVAIKPTPSIGTEQGSVNISNKTETTLKIEGRHDPCIVPRAVPCVEAAVGIVLLDMLLCEQK